MPVPPGRPDYVYRLGPLELEVWKIGSDSRIRYAYRLHDHEWSELPVFEADDFKMPEWAGLEETALDILAYLTLRQWDAEPWFFKDYTPEQLRWRDTRAEAFQQDVMAEARRVAARPSVKHALGARKKGQGPKEWSPRKGEKVEVVQNLGDAHPLDYGGYLVLRRTTPELTEYMAEFWHEPAEDEKYTVYRFDLDRYKMVDGFLVPYSWRPDWPHPVKDYDEWFHKDLGEVASYIGSTKEVLEKDFSSADPLERAWAHRAIGDYHGWDNLDSYPLILTRAEMEKRWPEYA